MKFLVDFQFQIGLGDRIEINLYATASAVINQYFVAFNPQDAAAEIALTVDGIAALYFGEATGETLVIVTFVKTSLQTRRRNFQGVCRVNEVFHVENSAQVMAHFGTILMSHAVWLINKDSNDWFVVWPGYFGVHQLQPVIDGDPFSYRLQALLDC